MASHPHDRDGDLPFDLPRAGEPLPPFPPEAGWLDAEPPPIGDDFVGRTLARLKDVGLVRGTAADAAPDDAALPADLLAQLRVPEPSTDFVARTLAAAQQNRADQWRRLLLRYEAPEPTSDFVGRTLAALRGDGEERALRAERGGPLDRRPRRWWLLALATAAAAALLFQLLPTPPAQALREYVAAVPAATAAANSPAVLSHLLADAPPHGALAAPDGNWLWLAAAEGRR